MKNGIRKKIRKTPETIALDVLRLKSRLVQRNEKKQRDIEDQQQRVKRAERLAERKVLEEILKLQPKPGSWPWGSWRETDDHKG